MCTFMALFRYIYFQTVMGRARRVRYFLCPKTGIKRVSKEKRVGNEDL